MYCTLKMNLSMVLSLKYFKLILILITLEVMKYETKMWINEYRMKFLNTLKDKNKWL